MDSSKQKIIQIVFNSFQKCIEIVVNGRQGSQPTQDSLDKASVNGQIESSKYIGVAVRIAEYDPYVPLCLEIMYTDVGTSNLITLERWIFRYDRASSTSSSTRSSISMSKRISILARTLYCFVRLLPAFYVIPTASSRLFYRISSITTPLDDLKYPTLSYEFPAVPMQSGTVYVNVAYVEPNSLQHVVKNGSAHQPVRRPSISKDSAIDRSDLNKRPSSSVPIPINGQAGTYRSPNSSAPSSMKAAGGLDEYVKEDHYRERSGSISTQQKESRIDSSPFQMVTGSASATPVSSEFVKPPIVPSSVKRSRYPDGELSLPGQSASPGYGHSLSEKSPHFASSAESTEAFFGENLRKSEDNSRRSNSFESSSYDPAAASPSLGGLPFCLPRDKDFNVPATPSHVHQYWGGQVPSRNTVTAQDTAVLDNHGTSVENGSHLSQPKSYRQMSPSAKSWMNALALHKPSPPYQQTSPTLSNTLISSLPVKSYSLSTSSVHSELCRKRDKLLLGDKKDTGINVEGDVVLIPLPASPFTASNNSSEQSSKVLKERNDAREHFTSPRGEHDMFFNYSDRFNINSDDDESEDEGMPFAWVAETNSAPPFSSAPAGSIMNCVAGDQYANAPALHSFVETARVLKSDFEIPRITSEGRENIIGSLNDSFLKLTAMQMNIK